MKMGVTKFTQVLKFRNSRFDSRCILWNGLNLEKFMGRLEQLQVSNAFTDFTSKYKPGTRAIVERSKVRGFCSFLDSMVILRSRGIF